MNSEPQIPDLLRDLRDDTTTLIREELALAKTEISEKLATASRNAAYLAVGATIVSTALLLLLIGFSYFLGHYFLDRGMEPGSATFLGFLMVAAIAGAIGAFLVAKSIKTLKGDSLTPEKAVQSLREDKQWAQNKLQ